MNKIIATAALSLTLVACSDNSSLTGSSQFTGAQKQVRNLSAQCIYGIHADAAENDLINSNENLSVTESGTIDRDKNISKIYPVNSEGFALVTIENINLTCSSYIVGVDVVAEGDTLFVDAKIESDENPLDCLCPRKVSFEVKYDSTFENVKYTKYDGYRIIPLQKVVPENQSNQTIERNISLRLGECRADGLGLRKDGSSGETDKAYLISGENGYQVFIPDLLGLMGTRCIVERLIHCVIHAILLTHSILAILVGTLLLILEALLLEDLLLLTYTHHALLHHLGHLHHHLLTLVALLLLHLNHLFVRFLLNLILTIFAVSICHSNLSIFVQMRQLGSTNLLCRHIGKIVVAVHLFIHIHTV